MEQVPGDAGPQDVAAALLCFFLALPEPLFRAETVSHSRPVSSQHAASDRLATFLAPADLAVAHHMIGQGHFLFRSLASLGALP